MDGRKLAAGRVSQAVLRVQVTAAAALEGGDVDGACAAAFDAYRMAAEALLVGQDLILIDTADQLDVAALCNPADLYLAVRDAVAESGAAEILAFARASAERFRRVHDRAQLIDPAGGPVTSADALWAIETADSAVVAVKALLAAKRRPGGRRGQVSTPPATTRRAVSFGGALAASLGGADAAGAHRCGGNDSGVPQP